MPFKVIQGHQFCYQSKAHVRRLYSVTLCALCHRFSTMCLVHETNDHPVKANSIALRIDASPSDPTRSCLKSQSTTRAATWPKKDANVQKSELPCINISPMNVGVVAVPLCCKARLRWAVTVTYTCPRLYVLSTDQTLPSCLWKQKALRSDSCRLLYKIIHGTRMCANVTDCTKGQPVSRNSSGSISNSVRNCVFRLREL